MGLMKRLMAWVEAGDRRQAKLMSEAGVISVWTYQQSKGRKKVCRCKDCKCDKTADLSDLPIETCRE